MHDGQDIMKTKNPTPFFFVEIDESNGLNGKQKNNQKVYFFLNLVCYEMRPKSIIHALTTLPSHVQRPN